MIEPPPITQVELPRNKVIRRVDKGRRFAGGIVGADRPVELDLSGTPSAAAGNILLPPIVSGPITASNGGGAIGTGLPVQLIFWGPAWNAPATNPSASTIISAIQTILGGGWMSGLRQYGVRRCTFGGSMIVTNPPPATYDDDDIETLVWSLIDEGTFPEPDEPGGRNIYVVFMPPGTTYGPGGIRGKHLVASDFDFPADVDKAWVAFVLTNSLDQITSTFCHELAETCTDPESDAWTVTGDQEIGDVCNFVDQKVGGVNYESYWSAADNACLLPTAYSVRRALQWSGHTLNGRGLTSIQGPIASLNRFVIAL
jgi:hypothetical protein